MGVRVRYASNLLGVGPVLPVKSWFLCSQETVYEPTILDFLNRASTLTISSRTGILQAFEDTMPKTERLKNIVEIRKSMWRDDINNLKLPAEIRDILTALLESYPSGVRPIITPDLWELIQLRISILTVGSAPYYLCLQGDRPKRLTMKRTVGAYESGPPQYISDKNGIHWYQIRLRNMRVILRASYWVEDHFDGFTSPGWYDEHFVYIPSQNTCGWKEIPPGTKSP